MDIDLSLGGIQAVLNSSLDVRDFIHNSKSDGSGENVISTMAFVPRFKTSGWPQAALNGLDVGGFFVDVYEASQPDASSISRGTTSANTPGLVAGCSKPGVVPWTDISWISARIAASNRKINGRYCHLITPFERFSVLSLIMAAGQWGQQRGNNNEGKDARDAASYENYGIIDPVNPSYRTITGSGPASWWHNGLPGRGIHNLVGNIFEWEDCRIESGLIQPKAFLNGVVLAGDSYLNYDDNGAGDGVNINQLTPGVYTITDAVNGNEDVTVERVIIDGRFSGRLILASAMVSNHGDNCLIQLKSAINLSSGVTENWVTIGSLLEDSAGKYMALGDKGDTTSHTATYIDSWYQYDNGDSRVLRRCGAWDYPTQARSGLTFGSYMTPSDVYSFVGFRAALSIGEL